MQGFEAFGILGDDMNKILPRVGVSKVIGFLEVVHDNNDSAETIQLAADLDLEIDGLLPVLDAAELLEFIEVKSGRVSLTPTGKKFVESNLLERRGVLRDQVTKIDTMKQVLDALKTKKSKKMSKKNLLKLFKSTMPAKDAESNTRFVIDWGRHTEILGYNSENEEIYLISE